MRPRGSEQLAGALRLGLKGLRRLREDGQLPFIDDGSLEEAVLPLALRLLSRGEVSVVRGRVPAGEASCRAPRVVALVGAPGCGKTTLGHYLSALFLGALGLQVAQLSLDDLYLSRCDRERLAQRVHPLFVQRGPPGTHDVALGLSTLASLRSALPLSPTLLPRFDKSADDLVPSGACPRFVGRPDWIFVDAWLWDVEAPTEASLQQPQNEREAREDPSGAWRRHAARALAHDYPQLFRQADEWVLLQSPSFAATVRFRTQQERARGAGARLRDPAAVLHFLQLFERWLALPHRSTPAERIVIDEEHRLQLEVERSRPG